MALDNNIENYIDWTSLLKIFSRSSVADEHPDSTDILNSFNWTLILAFEE